VSLSSTKSVFVPLVSIIAIAIGQLACSLVPGGTPSPTPSAPPTVVPATTSSSPSVDLGPTEPAAGTERAPSLPNRPLSDSGPWYAFMVFTAAHELWAMNADGSGLTMLWSYTDQDEDPTSEYFILSPAPSGARLAILQYDKFLQTAPVLRFMDLPSGSMQPIANLLPSEVEYESLEGEAQSAADQVWAAVGALNSLAWSPDARWLAFNAAIDGPSADVYVYDTSTERIERLTDGPNQSTDLVWSPDGSYVVHNVVDTLYYGYSGIGYGMLGAWAAVPDTGKPAIPLYDHAFLGFEHILGWLDDSRYLGDSFDGDSLGNCGHFNLRAVSMADGEGPVLFAGNYSWRAFDPTSKTMVLVLSSVLKDFDCNTSLDPGVYLFDPDTRETRLLPGIDPEPVQSATWSEEAGLFFLGGGEELIAIDPDGNVERYPSIENLFDEPPVVAPRGDRWVLTNMMDGVLAVGTRAGELTEIESERTWNAFWSLDGTWLFFFDDGMRLTAAPAPNFEPLTVIQEGLLGAESPVLVNP
jgi:hypothetical protein